MATPNRTQPATLLAELPQPSTAYKRRVWLAVAGLVLFLALYFLLAGWFLFTAYRLTAGADSPTFSGYAVGICALFLAVFMLKPVFFVRHGRVNDSVEVTAQQQPRLFAFLYELADAAAAPRPHRVFISPQVNAVVFYDLSLLNLVFPSRKNLEIGLALVNALTLGEFRAVLAHEFGHFTQRSMAVMRWAYIAQQIAAHLVLRRDKLDDLLRTLCHISFRVAWVGWLLSLIVWSIRSLVDSAFGALVLVQRALSREMEMQADLVAVALTGSDALVHALHRLQAADDSWNRTLAFLGHEHANKRIPRDVFALHSRVTERMGDILGDPGYGRVTPVPRERPAEHRVFKPDLAQPPGMWRTHPLNHEREANAKRRYVGAPIDDRSAWILFDDPAALREQISAVLQQAQGKETVPLNESLAALSEPFDREHLKSRYRGVYLGRSAVRGAPRPEALVEAAPADWRQQLDQLYPSTLVDEVARLRNLGKEIDQLRALASGAFTPSEGVIRHRGRTITRAELPRAIETVQAEARDVEERLRAGDRMRRAVHLAAAAELGGGWDPYLRGLLAVLHYADHTGANLRDLHGVFAHTLGVVTVTRRISSAGMLRLLDSANALRDALSDLFRMSQLVTLDTSLTGRLAIGSWTESLGTFALPPADTDNIGQWLNAIRGWVTQAENTCAALSTATLEQLLLTEAALAEHVRRGTSPGLAPAPSVVLATYDVLLPGAERKASAGLNWWERFQIAQGTLPTLARAAVAAGIVAVVLGFGTSVGTATITIYNGLALPVVVHVGGHYLSLRARSSGAVEVDARVAHRVMTRTRAGQVIDSFDVAPPGSFASFIYNVGGATPLVEWTAVYGKVPRRPEHRLGAPRWTRSSADVLFEDPPESITSSDSGGARLVLSGMADASPGVQLNALTSDTDRLRVIRAHAQWDDTKGVQALSWLMIAQARLPDYRQILARRLADAPGDVVLLRLEQDGADSAEKVRVCARHQARSDGAPDDADLKYVAARCIGDSRAMMQAFLEGHRRWPQHGWFANGAGYSYADAGQWQEAGAALEAALAALPPVAEFVAVDLARIRRLTNPDPGAIVGHLAKSSERLRYMLALENGTGVDSGPLLAYAELARGHLDQAVLLAHADATVEARVLRLAGASDGASAALMRRARALDPGAGLDDDTRWASIGLATRLGRDVTPLLDSLPARPEYRQRLRSFIAQVRRGANLSAAEQQLSGLPLAARGEAYSVGVIVLGGRAPAAWRHAAKQLLFAPERPYFK